MPGAVAGVGTGKGSSRGGVAAMHSPRWDPQSRRWLGRAAGARFNDTNYFAEIRNRLIPEA